MQSLTWRISRPCKGLEQPPYRLDCYCFRYRHRSFRKLILGHQSGDDIELTVNCAVGSGSALSQAGPLGLLIGYAIMGLVVVRTNFQHQVFRILTSDVHRQLLLSYLLRLLAIYRSPEASCVSFPSTLTALWVSLLAMSSGTCCPSPVLLRSQLRPP